MGGFTLPKLFNIKFIVKVLRNKINNLIPITYPVSMFVGGRMCLNLKDQIIIFTIKQSHDLDISKRPRIKPENHLSNLLTYLENT